MFSTTWRRPADIPYPKTWRTFEKTTKEGKLLKFKIQDITEEWHDEVVEFMTVQYLSDELWNSSSGTHTDPVFKEVFNYYIREVIYPQKACTICILENTEDDAEPNGNVNHKSSILVGCNLTGISEKDNQNDYSSMVTCKSAEKLLTIYMEMMTHCPNVYEKYNVDKNMGAFGLCIHRDYRGYSISKEMLLTRIPLCQAFGVKLSNTMFTGTISQIVAEKAGFITDACVPYKQIEDAIGFKMRLDYEFCKLMSLVIPEC